MSDGILRVGLVGVGGVCAAVHYPGLKLITGVEIAGICEPSEALRQARQSEWGIERAFSRMDEFLAAVDRPLVSIGVERTGRSRKNTRLQRINRA